MLYRLLANRKSSYCVAQCLGAKLRKWARHLVYASVYSSEYNKDLILMFIMSQLRTVFFFVFALFESPCPPPLWQCDKVLKPSFQSIISQTNNGCSLLSLVLAKPLLLYISCGNIFALSIVNASLHAVFRQKSVLKCSGVTRPFEGGGQMPRVFFKMPRVSFQVFVMPSS